MKPGIKTTEFLATSAGMFLVSLLALLTTFNLIHVTPEQQDRILDFAGIALIVLPSVYSIARSHVKGKAVAPANTSIAHT